MPISTVAPPVPVPGSEWHEPERQQPLHFNNKPVVHSHLDIELVQMKKYLTPQQNVPTSMDIKVGRMPKAQSDSSRTRQGDFHQLRNEAQPFVQIGPRAVGPSPEYVSPWVEPNVVPSKGRPYESESKPKPQPHPWLRKLKQFQNMESESPPNNSTTLLGPKNAPNILGPNSAVPTVRSDGAPNLPGPNNAGPNVPGTVNPQHALAMMLKTAMEQRRAPSQLGPATFEVNAARGRSNATGIALLRICPVACT